MFPRYFAFNAAPLVSHCCGVLVTHVLPTGGPAAMPTIPFNVRKIDSLRFPDRGRVDYWDEDTPGFGLRISDKGSRTWMVMYRVKGEGRQRRLKIGTYPT